MAGVFSVFALIYDPYYIYYGFITFIFGIAAHYIDCVGAFLISDSKRRAQTVITTQGILIIAWIASLVIIY